MPPLSEDFSPRSPVRRESIFKSCGSEQNPYSESIHRPLVLPVPPQRSAVARPLSPRHYPRFDVSHLLKRQRNEDVIYDEVATESLTRQSLSLSLSERSIRAFGGSLGIFKNKMLKRPSVLSLDARRCSSVTASMIQSKTARTCSLPGKKIRSELEDQAKQKVMIRILTPPELLLDSENQSPIAPVKSYSIRNRNPVPSVSVRELTNLQSTFRPVTPSTPNL